jgi:tetratricopeptide (TPR) repeat protein
MNKLTFEQLNTFFIALIALTPVFLFIEQLGTFLFTIANIIIVSILCIRISKHNQKPQFMATEIEVDTFEKLNTLIDETPTEPDYYYRRALLSHEMEKYKDAMTDLNKAIELNTNNPLVWKERAMVFMVDFDYDSAEADLKIALNLDFADQVDHFLTLEQSAIVHFNLNNYKASIDDCTNALEIIPDSDSILSHSSDSYWKLKDHNNALADITQAIDKNQHNSMLLIQRAEYYLELGIGEKAKKDLEIAIQRGNDEAKILFSEHFNNDYL